MKLFFIIFFIVVNSSFGQFKSGEVTYKVSPPTNIKNFLDTTGVKNPMIKKSFIKNFREARQATPLVSYQLKFNKSEALFNGKKYLSNDNGIDLNHIGGLSYYATKGVYYTNADKKTLLHQFKDFNKIWIVKKRTDTIAWHITKQSKIIQGYRCIKATTMSNFNDVKRGKVTAWFCPDLPFQYGPADFGGLPGLILGLKRNYFYFYADKISFSKKEKKIKRPIKGKLVSEQQYFKFIKKEEANMRR